MVFRWYQRRAPMRAVFNRVELTKLVLKSLIANKLFNLNVKIYFGKKFNRFSRFNSFSFHHRYCVQTGFTHAVFQRFKMVRHFCKFYASHGFLVGLRRASF